MSFVNPTKLFKNDVDLKKDKEEFKDLLNLLYCGELKIWKLDLQKRQYKILRSCSEGNENPWNRFVDSSIFHLIFLNNIYYYLKQIRGNGSRKDRGKDAKLFHSCVICAGRVRLKYSEFINNKSNSFLVKFSLLHQYYLNERYKWDVFTRERVLQINSFVK